MTSPVARASPPRLPRLAMLRICQAHLAAGDLDDAERDPASEARSAAQRERVRAAREESIGRGLDERLHALVPERSRT